MNPPVTKNTIEARLPTGTVEAKAGTSLISLLPSRRDSKDRPYLGAILNNRLVSLDTPLWTDSDVELVTVRIPLGAQIYRRSATYVLLAAVADLFPEVQLEVGQSMGQGYHFNVVGNGGDSLDLERIEARMREITEADTPIERRVVSLEEATELFVQLGRPDKVRLLEVWASSHVHLATVGSFTDIQHGPVAPSAGVIDDFALLPMEPGFVLHFSTKRSPVWRASAWNPKSKLFASYQETHNWNEILGVRTVGDLNSACLSDDIEDIIRITECFHEKKIAGIADAVAERQPEVRVVLIAGPSSSGKTTFSKRLTTQLRVNGIRPVTLSLDNYYVDREKTPLNPDGTYDFEAIEAIDLPLFNDQLARLLAGEEVDTPRYNFQTGLRVIPERWKSLHLNEDQILLIEGIHGLNDRLTESVPVEAKFRIYVSALTQLRIDRSNRIATSDARLLRRLVRDRRYRGYSAAETIANWPSVRRGEYRNLFPFQDRCDVMFNSALVYEPAVLKVLAERYLLEVPRDHPSAATAHALRKFLQLFVPVFADDVPRTSLLREFIGGSAFDY